MISNATISESSSTLLVGSSEICCLTSSSWVHLIGFIFSLVFSGKVHGCAFTFTVTLLYFSDFSITSVFKTSHALDNSNAFHVNSSMFHDNTSHERFSHVKLCSKSSLFSHSGKGEEGVGSSSQWKICEGSKTVLFESVLACSSPCHSEAPLSGVNSAEVHSASWESIGASFSCVLFFSVSHSCVLFSSWGITKESWLSHSFDSSNSVSSSFEISSGTSSEVKESSFSKSLRDSPPPSEISVTTWLSESTSEVWVGSLVTSKSSIA